MEGLSQLIDAKKHNTTLILALQFLIIFLFIFNVNLLIL